MTTFPKTLKTKTPEDGYALAITLSRLGIKAVQPDMNVLHRLRPIYSEDAANLIASSHVIAVHFQTISAANNGWR